MKKYRIYNLNRHGAIVGGSDIICSSDAAAFARAEATLAPSEQGEIWRRDRLVGRTFGDNPIVGAGTPETPGSPGMFVG